MKPNAVVIADYTPLSVLQYFQIVEGRRPDVRVVNSQRLLNSGPVRIPLAARLRDWPGRPIYLVDFDGELYDLDTGGQLVDIGRAGVLFEVRRR